jgi:hypothetical protein
MGKEDVHSAAAHLRRLFKAGHYNASSVRDFRFAGRAVGRGKLWSLLTKDTTRKAPYDQRMHGRVQAARLQLETGASVRLRHPPDAHREGGTAVAPTVQIRNGFY